ncbi:MAG: FliI/YscN family ATPase [Deltaproteobacteria bacterium]|nr:FliI/YscN family ATPase [Deltaproteobacteria bacterium]
MSLEQFCSQISHDDFVTPYGQVEKVRRDSIVTVLPRARVGALCQIQSHNRPVSVEVVSLSREGHVAMPLDDLQGVQLGDAVRLEEQMAQIPVGEALLGSVIDSMGASYESSTPLRLDERMPLYGIPSNPLTRSPIIDSLDLGIRSINACLTCGKGQRVGIFSGSGVGKSILLGMMARFTAADVVVIGLVGERGREVREFIENELGEEGRKKSVLVVETSDKSPVRRCRAAYVATTVAEYFRSRGAHVLLLMDSLTRFAMAQREIGLAAGEPPTAKGYPPSVFANLAKLVERAGNWGANGSITGLYTVLVEGDDLEDPVADHARATLDGHIVLARKLANRGHYPAVDILTSVSRVMDQITEAPQIAAARKMKEILSRYLDNEDAIHYGMYAPGTDTLIDQCIELEPKIRQFLGQERLERATLEQSVSLLNQLISL